MNETGVSRKEEDEGHELADELSGEMNNTIADRIRHLKETRASLELEADEAETDSTKAERAKVNEILNQFLQLQQAIKANLFNTEKIENLFQTIEASYEKLDIKSDQNETQDN